MDISVSGCLLQATRTINEILLQPTCLREVDAIFPQLFLALLFQVSFTTELTLQEVQIFWKEHQQYQLTPIRCSIPGLSSLPDTWSQDEDPGGSWPFLLVQVCSEFYQSAALRHGF